MQPVDATEHSCPSAGAGQDEPLSTEVQQAKRWSRPGVAAIEYCLLLSLIMVFLIIAVQSLGLESKGIFQRMATIFASDGASTGGDDDDDRGKGKAKGKNNDDDRGKGKGKGKNDGDDDRGKSKGKGKGKGKKR